MELTPQDWITLARKKQARFKAVAPVSHTSTLAWKEDDKRLLIDCSSDLDVETITDHITQVSWLAWLVLGCEELGVYCGDSIIFEGDTRRIPPIESGTVPDLLGEAEDMVATLDREQVKELVIQELQPNLDEQIDAIADETLQEYFKSPEFADRVKQRLAQRWGNSSPSTASTNGTTATIEAPPATTETTAAEPAPEASTTTTSFEISRSYATTLWNAFQAWLPDAKAQQDMLAKIRGKRKEGKEFLNRVVEAYPEEKRAKAIVELIKPANLNQVKGKIQPIAKTPSTRAAKAQTAVKTKRGPTAKRAK